ncbi:BON domain-containing protein [Magnetovibrio sp.]|uniref:BON domain-containing protein n=1 Tax=Magnetovibrio sp. TaxID=2024836 RepID=UPI002F9491D8
MTLPSNPRTALSALAIGCALLVTACTPVGAVLGVGAGTGIAAYQERGVDGVARDIGLSSRILDQYARNDHTLLAHVGVEVYESRALLTGQVKTEDERAKAVRLAWKVDGITDVINEIHVTTDGGIIDTARDSWISAQLEAKLTFDEKILAINYAIETVGGTVYLIGIAQSADELERVKNHARAIEYVRHIVSHVRIKAPDPAANPPATTQGS